MSPEVRALRDEGVEIVVDHIIPCAAFDFSIPEHQRICFHYTFTLTFLTTPLARVFNHYKMLHPQWEGSRHLLRSPQLANAHVTARSYPAPWPLVPWSHDEKFGFHERAPNLRSRSPHLTFLFVCKLQVCTVK